MKIGIVSAEPSGDLLGSNILRALRNKFDNLEVNVEPRPDNNEFVVNVLFDIIGQEFPQQNFTFILQATR